MSGVYYSGDVNAWMRTGSNKIYASKEKAERAAALSEKARDRYYKRLENLELDYSLIYNRYIFSIDKPNAGPSDPEKDLEGGTEKGRGFYRLFVKNCFSDTIPLGDIIADAIKWPDVAEFLRSTIIDYSDPVVKTALIRLMNRAGLF